MSRWVLGRKTRLGPATFGFMVKASEIDWQIQIQGHRAGDGLRRHHAYQKGKELQGSGYL